MYDNTDHNSRYEKRDDRHGFGPSDPELGIDEYGFDDVQTNLFDFQPEETSDRLLPAFDMSGGREDQRRPRDSFVGADARSQDQPKAVIGTPIDTNIQRARANGRFLLDPVPAPRSPGKRKASTGRYVGNEFDDAEIMRRDDGRFDY